jgi:hypothetical protein
MTLPTLIVDPTQLTSASSALSASAGNIPTELPKFSVAGDDPLSAAISAGAVDVESPMLALPAIKAKATTTAENIGVAAQRYRETDEAFASKVAGHNFAAGAATANGDRAGGGGGSGRFKTAFGAGGKDLPPLSPAATPGGIAFDLPPLTDDVDENFSVNDLVGATGDGMKAEVKKATQKGWEGFKGAAEAIEGTGKLLTRTSAIVDSLETASDMYNQMNAPGGAAFATAAADHLPNLGLQLGAGALGAEGGMAAGAALGTMIFPGVGTINGAGLGGFAGSLLASKAGAAAGETMSAGIHAFAAADSFVDAWATVPGAAGNMITAAGNKVVSIFGG